MPSHLLPHFACDATPAIEREVLQPIADLARLLDANAHLPDSPEKAAGMRKLMEARDCFKRAIV